MLTTILLTIGAVAGAVTAVAGLVKRHKRKKIENILSKKYDAKEKR